MLSRSMGARLSLYLLVATIPAMAQSFQVQCPVSTITHPDPTNTGVNNAELAYKAATSFSIGADGYQTPTGNVNGAIKCQQISGGDGYASMGDGTQTYMFSFGPLSGLADVANGLPGTQFPNVFNQVYGGNPLMPGDPATTIDANGAGSFTFNGAIGLTPDLDANGGNGNATAPITGHVDARQIMDIGVMNGNIPGPLMAIDEDDEFFLTLTNVGMIMRPDLFEQHTVHFHGYPNASSFYDGVPDASVAINIGGSFTYYYLAPDAGTYFWHCHITPPEHLQMGMVGQIYVRPRQNRVPFNETLYDGLVAQQADARTACRRPGDGLSPAVSAATDILCTNELPAGGSNGVKGGFVTASVTGRTGHATKFFAYNDGDGSTQYDVEYPLQIHGFDPNFHFVGMTFNPEGFADMKDKYFLLNGRSYPDTVHEGPLETQSADGMNHFSQPLPAIINIPAGKRALLRISDLDVSEYQTLASMGIPMTVIAINAKLLRDQDGNNLYYKTNSITLGGGESLDVILDACAVRATNNSCMTPYPTGTYYLYTPNLDHLANDAENFGGLMTEVRIN
jgi:hypothetical protein